MSVDIPHTVGVYISALKELGASSEAQKEMRESASGFLNGRQEKDNFQHLMNSAVRHLGHTPQLLKKLNLIFTIIKCRVVVVHDAYDGSSTLFVVHTSNETFVISTHDRDSDVQASLDCRSLRLAIQNAELDEFPKEILEPPSTLWAGVLMELLLSEMRHFPTLYEQGNVDDSYMRRCARCLRRLSKKSSGLPPSYFMYDAVKEGQNSVSGGGFSDIWKGRLDGIPVCLKVLRFNMGLTKREYQYLIQTFCREALYWGRLDHPNILPFLGVDEQMFSPSFCLISPWMDNGSIMNFLDKNPKFDRLKAAIDVAEGMRYLHELDPPIVHADIRGANILVTEDLRCCLADFGLAAATEITITSVRKQGAEAWMAPELLHEIPPGTSPSPSRDIYAFGCTLFEIFTGQRPFAVVSPMVVLLKIMNGERPSRPVSVLGSEVTDEIWAVIEECWRQQPSERPSARQVLTDLGVPPAPSYTLLRRPDPGLGDDALSEKLRLDKAYLLQLIPINQERPCKAFLDIIHEELASIEVYLKLDIGTALHFNLGTSLRANIRNPLPHLIDEIDNSIPFDAQYAKHRSDRDYLARLMSVHGPQARKAFLNKIEDELKLVNTRLTDLDLLFNPNLPPPLASLLADSTQIPLPGSQCKERLEQLLLLADLDTSAYPAFWATVSNTFLNIVSISELNQEDLSQAAVCLSRFTSSDVFCHVFNERYRDLLPKLLQYSPVHTLHMSGHKMAAEPFREVINGIVPQIIGLLKETDEAVQSAATTALSTLCEHVLFHESIKGCLPQIIKLFKDSEDGVRSTAVTALSEMAQHGMVETLIKDSVPEIINLFKDTSYWTRDYGSKTVDSLFQHVVFHKSIKDYLPQIIELLKDTDKDVRYAALTMIGALSEHVIFQESIKVCVPQITKLLKDADEDVHSAAGTTVQRLLWSTAAFHESFKDTVPQIVELLRDNSSSIRSTVVGVVYVLSVYSTFHELIKPCVPQIIELLTDTENLVGYALNVMTELAKHTTIHELIKPCVPQIIELLTNTENFVIKDALNVMTELAEHTTFHELIKPCVPQIIELLESTEWYVCSAAATAMGKLAEHRVFHESIKKCVPQIICLLNDTNTHIQYAAITSLGTISGHAVFHESIIDCLLQIIELLGKPAEGGGSYEADVSWASGSAIKKFASQAVFYGMVKAAVPQITKLLQASDTNVQSAARMVLEKLATIKDRAKDNRNLKSRKKGSKKGWKKGRL